jgi:F420-dependent oxidoreductase-like protein
MGMKHSIFMPTGFTGELGEGDPVQAHALLTTLVQVADQEDFHTAWVIDHFQTMPPSQANLFECWTLVAGFLRDTTRLRIGQLVTGNGYRHPVLQAKMAATADVLGDGRFTFGIGAGWYEPDYRAFGLDFRDAPARLRALGEAVQIIRSLWTHETTTFEGEHYRVHDAVCRPRGVQRPHIPMMIAGGGEKVTLKLVARYGDACNMLAGPDGLRRKFAILREHCEAVGRDYDEIHRTATTPCVIADSDEEALAAFPPGAGALWDGDVREYGLIGTPDTIRERVQAYADAGVQELAISFVADDIPATMRRYAAELIARHPEPASRRQ